MIEDPIRFTLDCAPLADGSVRLTTARLAVWCEGAAIWPIAGAPDVSVEIQVDDLLSHITEFWKPLMLRQTYPVGLLPERPSLLRSEAERRWASHPAAMAEREDSTVGAFEDAHDLSRCFAGQFGLPPLWLLREGDRMLVETRDRLYAVPFGAARDALIGVGDEIASRLNEGGGERWGDLVAAWHERDRGDPALILAWSAGLRVDMARDFLRGGVLTAPADVTEAANDDDEARISARMSGSLPPEQIRQIISLVSRFLKTDAPELDRLGSLTSDHVEAHFRRHRPHEQGEAAADFVRQTLALAPDNRVDIADVVRAHGPILIEERVTPAALRALAVWGRSHGPAIIINRNGRDARRPNASDDPAARVTLAHEFCHLLLDRGHALTAVEVLGSRMPLTMERRAKAFAGEFLLPARVAADAWYEAKSPRSLASVGALLRTLVERFGVTRSVAAWKLEHGLHRHDIDLGILLDAVAPNR